MNIELRHPKAKMPTRGSEWAAGLDLYSVEDVAIKGGETVLVDTGIAIELNLGTFGAIYPRSGLASKRNLTLANAVGVIDADYRGTIKVALHNLGKETQEVHEGERIAQLVVQMCIMSEPKKVTNLSNTVRGTGGFGSTGK